MSAGVTPEVNLRECVTHKPLPSVNKTDHSGFETQRTHHQKSKTGISMAPHKGLQHFFLKKGVHEASNVSYKYLNILKRHGKLESIFQDKFDKINLGR